jgi:ABC-type Zn2+ transport system substrate-binding protein/surface adhesin
MDDAPPAYVAHDHGSSSSSSHVDDPQPAATYNVLSSAASLSSSAISHATLLRPSEPAASRGAESFMRFTPGTSAPAATGLSNYQASQAAHAAHIAEVDRADREARQRDREERLGRERERDRDSSHMHQRKHSISVSSKSHKTDMNGQWKDSERTTHGMDC